MGFASKLAGQTAIYGLSSILGRFLNFMLVPLYTRCLPPSEYGIVTEFYSYVAFLIILLTYGMETGFFYFMEEKDDRPKVFSTILTSLFSSSAIFVALVFLLLTPISNFLGYPDHKEFILIMAVTIGIDAFVSVPFAKLRYEEKAVKFATLKLINIGLNIGLNLLFLVGLPKLAQITSIQWLAENFAQPNVIYIFISNLVASASSLLLLLPDILKSRNGFDARLLRRIFSYSWPILVSGLAGSINEVYDRISLRHFLTIPEGADETAYILDQVGIYGANYKLAMIISIIIQAYRYAIEPILFKKDRENDQTEKQVKVMSYYTVFILTVFLGVVFYIDIIKHFLGDKYHIGLGVVPVLLAANIFLGIVFNLSFWYKLTNKTRMGIWITGFGAIVTMTLNILFVPKYGYVACAWATLACYVSMSVLSYILCQKYCRIPFRIGSLACYFLLAALLYAANSALAIESTLALYALRTAMILIFVGVTVGNELRIAKKGKR